MMLSTEGYRARNTATPSDEDTWGNGQKNQILFISTVIQIQHNTQNLWEAQNKGLPVVF